MRVLQIAKATLAAVCYAYISFHSNVMGVVNMNKAKKFVSKDIWVVVDKYRLQPLSLNGYNLS